MDAGYARLHRRNPTEAGYRIIDLDDRDTRAEAILPQVRDSKEPAHVPGHVLATLWESDVRDGIAAILEADPDIGDHLTPHTVSDAEIHHACLTVAATINLSEEAGDATFRAALMAYDLAKRRHTSNS
jgi:hypothetical protein